MDAHARSAALKGTAAAAIAAALLLAGCGSDRNAAGACHLASDGTVLAIGDSITRGHGADGQGYPEQLQTLLRATPARASVRVVNMGIDGERSAGLLERIDTALGANTPAVVLITTGGNDLLRKMSEAELRTNLTAIVQRVRTAGAYPVVFAVPRPTLVAAAGFGSDHALYEELAEGGTAVIPEVVGDILAQEELRSDTIHPNQQGYALMAQAAFEAISECR